ncbi:MAG: SIS domain-containing protein [Ignavibacteriales bacterium]|nr:SIS domain-containing protein [Ignavibacteriales bacterium]
MSFHNDLSAQIQASIDAKTALLADERALDALNRVVEKTIEVYRAGGKVLVAGNGGSAADAQHFAAELVCRFTRVRKGIPAIALTTDTSILTAVSNDFGYERVFERQVEAMGERGDVFFGISTSGSSPNVVKAMEKARETGLTTVGMTSAKPSRVAELSDIAFQAPSEVTARAQEIHLLAIHIICDLVERELFQT